MTPSLPTGLTDVAASGRIVSRREVLAAVGGAAGVSWSRADAPSVADAAADTSVQVRVYSGPLPLRLRLPNAVAGSGDWPPSLRDATAAVEDAITQVLDYARERSRLESLEITVERAGSIQLSRSAVQRPSDAVVPSLETVLDGFHRRLRERDALTGSTCHLLLCWEPLNYQVGYGGTLSPNAHVGDDADGSPGDALTVANVGASEVWDSRDVTRNMAIHETLHTFLSSDVVEAVGDSPCDHDLGAAIRTADETLHVSPMASAYAGRNEIGSGTRFHGTGCYDHEAFHRHGGTDGVENWTHTTELSEATLEGATRYLERTVGP
ncbi:hypothetical protein Htur_0232 [Haloterrigena turkmenica DSM 5511]|uniref:Uncharacterized protein n=1 Tax=Haloterrigena turkmenica (strain ATCC 51198 / DSM 5511 / JCM 9101 / NCIMB 13204 / VKM B-1734 / 4k) TaxID=543526 RepID=D2RU64_HALTV|nr:hypothetical protein [Haloterrigena turkmenica]ADB59133.1 hypothetical protein Htur_0232 [Haloterrigena turkmenica DSM 5511]